MGLFRILPNLRLCLLSRRRLLHLPHIRQRRLESDQIAIRI